MCVCKAGKTINFMRMEFLSCPENVALARIAAASFAAQLEMTLNDLEELKVAVSEAVSNCIIHGYDNQPVGVIRLTTNLYEGTLEIIIDDDGKGIEDVEQAMQPTFSTVPERMGLGFVFMKSFMDEVVVNSTVNQGTQVILRKVLAFNQALQCSL
ncbi:MAG: anti-sigma F factor [Clostridia bacterium]|nr:anti-sigma F factor [Clostridia bacterium]